MDKTLEELKLQGGVRTVRGTRSVVKRIRKRSASPKRVVKASPKRHGVHKKRSSRIGGYQQEEHEHQEHGTDVKVGGARGHRKSRSGRSKSRSNSPVRKVVHKRKAHKKTWSRGGNDGNDGEDEEEKKEEEMHGGGRKRKHTKMCAKKPSAYNLFVKKRMCEMRKQTKSPVVELMKKIAAEWKAKK